MEGTETHVTECPILSTWQSALPVAEGFLPRAADITRLRTRESTHRNTHNAMISPNTRASAQASKQASQRASNRAVQRASGQAQKDRHPPLSSTYSLSLAVRKPLGLSHGIATNGGGGGGGGIRRRKMKACFKLEGGECLSVRKRDGRRQKGRWAWRASFRPPCCGPASRKGARKAGRSRVDAAASLWGVADGSELPRCMLPPFGFQGRMRTSRSSCKPVNTG